MTIATTSSLHYRPTRVFAYLLSPFPYRALAALPPNTSSSFFFTARSPTAGAYVCCLVVLSFTTVLGAKSNTRLQGS